LVEILVAIAIIMIGLVAVMQWFPLGLQGVETGRQQSTAVFLGEQKIEQIKAWAQSACAGPPTCPTAQGFASITNGSPSTAPCCAAEGYNSIPGYPGFRRQVNVSDGPDGTKQVQVQVFYRPLTSQGVGAVETRIQLVTLFSN